MRVVEDDVRADLRGRGGRGGWRVGGVAGLERELGGGRGWRRVRGGIGGDTGRFEGGRGGAGGGGWWRRLEGHRGDSGWGACLGWRGGLGGFGGGAWGEDTGVKGGNTLASDVRRASTQLVIES